MVDKKTKKSSQPINTKTETNESKDSKSAVAKNGNGKNGKPKVRKVELKFAINSKKIKTWLIIILGFLFILPLFMPAAPKEISLSQAITDIKSGQVKKIQVDGDLIKIEYKDKQEIASARKEPQNSFYDLVADNQLSLEGIDVNIKDLSGSAMFLGILEIVLPLIIISVVAMFVFRQ